MEKINAKVEPSRGREVINTTGVRALVMLLVRVMVLAPLFYSGLVFALPRFYGP